MTPTKISALRRNEMILADKIILQRKKAGWSQEELAEQLGVSRQSVSKWEGAQSIPDMDKLLKMSRLFGVSTDYLLKDEIDDAPAVLTADESDTGLRRVTMEEASDYLGKRRAAAPKIAFATFLCIISPIVLLIMAGLADSGKYISEGAAAGIGLSVLLLLVAVGAAIFLSCGARVKAYDFLGNEPFETEYGVSGMVREKKKNFETKFSRMNILGAVLCILSAVPIFIALCFDGAENTVSDMIYILAVCALFFIAGIGVFLFVYGGVYNAAMEKLLEEGDYTRKRKASGGIIGTVSLVYWLVTTAVFLIFLYSGAEKQMSWIIWAVAGVLYGAVTGIISLVMKSKDK